MNTPTKLLARALLLASLMLSAQTQAALIEWTFTATVQEIDGSSSGMATYGIVTGTTLSVTFLLDNSVNGNAAGDNIWYDGAVVGVDVSAGIFQASLDPAFNEFNTVVVRDQAADVVGASASLRINNGSDSAIGFLATQFSGSDGQLIDSTLFPSIPDFEHVDAFGSGTAGGTFMSFQTTVDGVFTTVVAEISLPQARFVPVPLPGALLFMGSGLLALFGVGKPQ